MKALVVLVCLMGLVLGYGCEKAAEKSGGPAQTQSKAQAQDAKTAKEAISYAKTLQTAQEQGAYLLKKANELYNSQEFQQAVDIAQYVLRYIDKDSAEAQSLLNKAKEALMKQAGSVVDKSADALKDKLSSFGK